MMQPVVHTLLHPTDFSPHSELAFQLACSLARDHRARLVILHVANPPVVMYDEKGELLPQRVDYRVTARDQLARLISNIAIPVECRVEEGEVNSLIQRIAKEIDADLIVMGSQGRTGLDRLLIGSVAQDVLRTARCPVLTVGLPKSKKTVTMEAADQVSTGNR